tara:strand:+ start:737 stop:1198 length:462 start_codon:yes stop_codon:yes gene_type:complete
MTQKLTKEEIAEIKRKRNIKKRLMTEQLRLYVGYASVPAIMIMVGTLVASAHFLSGETLAVVSSMVSTVTMGIIQILQQMTAPPEKENEVLTLAKEVSHTNEKLIDESVKQKPVAIKLNDKEVVIGSQHTFVEASTTKNAVWGDDKPLKKGGK